LVLTIGAEKRRQGSEGTRLYGVEAQRDGQLPCGLLPLSFGNQQVGQTIVCRAVEGIDRDCLFKGCARLIQAVGAKGGSSESGNGLCWLVP
jgi:hypothetical protein